MKSSPNSQEFSHSLKECMVEVEVIVAHEYAQAVWYEFKVIRNRGHAIHVHDSFRECILYSHGSIHGSSLINIDHMFVSLWLFSFQLDVEADSESCRPSRAVPFRGAAQRLVAVT